MDPRSLTTRLFLLALLLIVAGFVFGLNGVDVATGLTNTTSCGSAWFPDLGPAGPLADGTATPEQCTAVTVPRALLAATLLAAGLVALTALLAAKLIISAIRAVA